MVLTPHFLLPACTWLLLALYSCQQLSRCLSLLAFKVEQFCAVCLVPAVRLGRRLQAKAKNTIRSSKLNTIAVRGRRRNFRGGFSLDIFWSWQKQSDERKNSRPSEIEHWLVRGWKKQADTAREKRSDGYSPYQVIGRAQDWHLNLNVSFSRT